VAPGVAATQSHAPSPPTRHPDSSGTIIVESFTAFTIESCTGTRAVEVDWAPWLIAPAVRLTPRRASRLDVF
jgi:hypothetical protein